MFSIKKCMVFLALLLTTATALSHGHIAARIDHHGVARSLVDDLTKKDATIPSAVLRRRGGANSSRCKARSSSSSSTSSSTTDHAKATPAKANQPPAPTSSATSTWSKHTDPPKTSSDAPKASPKAGSGGGGGGQSFSGGSATYFLQNGQAGACGQTHSDSDMICALFTSVYDNGSHCGKSIEITNLSNGKTITALVADECPTCDGPGCVDLSQGAFGALGGTQDEGEFTIDYHFV